MCAAPGGESTPRDDAVRLLARREYSRAELAGRLAAKNHAAESIQQTLDALEAEGLQSDARFAESFVRSRLVRGQGPMKVRAGLHERGIERELARVALDEAQGETDWRALACEALAKRFDGPGATPRERARRERFLAGRGFDFEQMKYALAHAWDAPD
ncbi:regulatory protein RecX [Halomonas sp. HP20-15]|uniref:regulatory protein RecX n=1 Tax=Halomonas sp. HP20-15 TaxID=3085901 RepID=UPI002980B0C6|nr:regulatory protein RecX [Halomonas sp. HP20-15]MDW5377319.1 regulatory protein RecX [Halomonas sp. HP20-15]